MRSFSILGFSILNKLLPFRNNENSQINFPNIPNKKESNVKKSASKYLSFPNVYSKKASEIILTRLQKFFCKIKKNYFDV